MNDYHVWLGSMEKKTHSELVDLLYNAIVAKEQAEADARALAQALSDAIGAQWNRERVEIYNTHGAKYLESK